MLEPLPQGKHDRRVSSAESEARQDWPSKPTEDSVATQSPTHAWIRRRGSSAPVLGGICRPAPPACSRSDRDIEASADHGGAVSRARFYGKRRSAAQTRWARTAICPSTDPWCRQVWHCRIVKARQNQWHDERHKDWPRNRRTNAAEWPQHRETAGHHFWDRSLHADVTVQIYSEVSNRSRRNNDVDADTQTGLWNLMLTSNGCTPEHFRLGCVELKTIRLHPFCNVIHASRNPLLQLQDIRRWRVAADLRVVSIQMRNEVMLFDAVRRQKDGSPMVWIGGGAPQGGRSRQTSYYRHRCHPTSWGGPGSRSLLRFSSHNESACGPSCQDLPTCFYHLRRLRSIRRSLGRDVTARLVSALVISRLDYCNSVLAHLPASTLRVINAAARMVVDLRPRDHVTPALYELHWLPIAERIKFKLCLLPISTPVGSRHFTNFYQSQLYGSTTVVMATHGLHWKWQSLTPCQRHPSEPIEQIFGTIDFVIDLNNLAKFRFRKNFPGRRYTYPTYKGSSFFSFFSNFF